MLIDRRQFLQASALGAAGLALACPSTSRAVAAPAAPPFSISLAQWSLHRALKSGAMDPLDFARRARADFGIDALEYVNQFYVGKAGDAAYTRAMRQRAQDEGVRNVLIMCDGEGALGDPDEAKRRAAVANHHKWADLAALLGCHSIRVNAQSEGAREEQARLAADGLHQLALYVDKLGLDVIVENHGGLSSHGDWLADVMRRADHPRVGTLPDFGNFYEYDRYQGVADMMPFARGVSAKSYAFDAQGNETKIDFRRMLGIVLGAGYHGRIGIEYEGDAHSEPEGIRLTKALLERLRAELARPAAGADKG